MDEVNFPKTTEALSMLGNDGQWIPTDYPVINRINNYIKDSNRNFNFSYDKDREYSANNIISDFTGVSKVYNNVDDMQRDLDELLKERYDWTIDEIEEFQFKVVRFSTYDQDMLMREIVSEVEVLGYRAKTKMDKIKMTIARFSNSVENSKAEIQDLKQDYEENLAMEKESLSKYEALLKEAQGELELYEMLNGE